MNGNIMVLHNKVMTEWIHTHARARVEWCNTI